MRVEHDQAVSIRVSRRADIEAIEARAPVDPEILRRWRDPDAPLGPDAPDAEARHQVPALAPVDSGAQTIDVEPASKSRRRRRLALLGIALVVAAGAGGWVGYRL